MAIIKIKTINCIDCKVETKPKKDFDVETEHYKKSPITLYYNQCPKCEKIYTPHSGEHVTRDELIIRTVKEIKQGGGPTYL